MNSGYYGCVSIPWLRKKIFGMPIILPNLPGYLIRLATWSKYDHCFIDIGNGQIIEAQPTGSIISPLSKYKYDSIKWYTGPLVQSERDVIVSRAHSLLGTPYGFLDILYLALSSLGIKYKPLLYRVERQDRLICSQLVASCGEYAKVDSWLCNKENPCLVTPADLANLIKSA